MRKSKRFQSSTLTWRKEGKSLNSCNTWMRQIVASSATIRMTGFAGGIAYAGRIVVAGRTVNVGSSCGLGDRLRTLVGGRVRMMPLCGRGCGCFIRLVVESGKREDWGGVREDDICVYDVLAH